MEANKILSAQLIDVIFDGRNKEYGAYELRKSYAHRIRKALFITLIITASIFGGVILAGTFKKSAQRYQVKEAIELAQIQETPPPEKLPEPEPQREPEPARTQKFTAQIEIKPDDQLTEPTPAQSDLDSAGIASHTQAGRPDIHTVEPPPEIKSGIIDLPVEKNDDPVSFVEIDAKFNGNWKAFLERNLNPQVATDNNAPPGRYSVVMQFVVDLEGKVSDIKALTSHGYGLEDEAIRVLKKAAKWEPAIQNGKPVKAYRRQTIIFEVPEE